MQHISDQELPATPNGTIKGIHRGGRISSPKLRASLTQAQEFCGLEEEVNKYDLLLLVKRVGKGAGFSTKMISLLDYYMAFTRDIDWEEGSQPIVYQSLSRTALDLGVSERQIQKLEKALFEVGALTWNDSGNHRRFGQRCDETGCILYAYGVDLTPLAYLKADLEEKIFQKQAHDRAWMETKRQISWYRAQIRAVLAELELIEDIDPPHYELVSEYNDIAVQIRTTMSLENTQSRLVSHKELYAKVVSILDSHTQEHVGSVIESKETKKGSSKSEQIGTHYKYTKKQQSNKLDTSMSQDELGPKLFQGRSKPNLVGNRLRGEDTDRLAKKKKEEAPILEGKEILTECGLQHITLKQALNASSERFRANMPIAPRPMNWNDFIEASYALKAELNISQQAWANACVVLGRSGAAICVLLTDQATLREEDKVLKPAGYFNAMINRAKSGELHLHNSIFGILKREGEAEV